MSGEPHCYAIFSRTVSPTQLKFLGINVHVGNHESFIRQALPHAQVHEGDGIQTPVSHPPDDGDSLHQAHVPEVDRTQTTPVPQPPDDWLLHDWQELTTEVIYTTEEVQAVESLEDIQLFAEFPTPELLRDANKQYAELNKPVEYDSEGVVEPYPVASRKQSGFELEKHQDLDLHSVQVRT